MGSEKERKGETLLIDAPLGTGDRYFDAIGGRSEIPDDSGFLEVVEWNGILMCAEEIEE